MKKILMTGGSGFIGQAIINRLFEHNFEVYLPDSRQLDITNFEGVKKVLKEYNPNFIIHLAARTEVEKSFYEPTSFSYTNYVGTINMIEVAKTLPELELFIFSSTMETYGHQTKENWKAFDENTPQYPNAPYAVAKMACELYLKYAGRAYGFPFTILRQTNTYGREDNDYFVVEQIITQMLKNSKEINLGYREPYRNFLYIDDLVSLYCKVLYNVDLAKNEIFCTGPDNAIQISELVEVIKNHVGWDGQINWGTKPARPGEIYYLNSTSKKAERVLNWRPQIRLGEGVRRTITKWQNKLNLT